MRLQEKIDHDIKNAIKAKEVDKLAALRAVKAAIMLEVTKKGDPIVSDDVSLKIISRLVKQRKDSAVIFIEQNRKDLADEEITQLAYLESYLPKKMEEEEVKKVVKEVISKIGASSISDIGKCMPLLIDRLNGKTDGALISKLVKEELS
tara:strand:- start:1492 stop:1938 length:447 start_codon:yes stop_codon:yes gene_type:complete